MRASAGPVASDNRRQGRRHGGLKAFAPESMAEHVRCFSNPATVHATCEDDRAFESIDPVHDTADRGSFLTAPQGRRRVPSNGSGFLYLSTGPPFEPTTTTRATG